MGAPLSQRQEVETDISTFADDVPDASVKPYNAAPAEPETFGQNVAELEAQVKAGQSISVLDLANAMKKDKKPLEKSPKISILAHIEKSGKEAAKAKEQPRTSLKRDGKDVLGG